MNGNKTGSSLRKSNDEEFSQADYLAHIRKLTEEVQQALDHIPIETTPATPHHGEPLRCAKRLEKERLQRLKYFPDNLVRDPAWPLLLELYRCRAEDIEISVTSLSIGMNIPSATGHRWIEELQRSGMATLSPCNNDLRRTIVAMTNGAFSRMDDYLRTIC